MSSRIGWQELAAQLGVEWPLLQAPMGGGITTPELVAAVCNAGGMGSFAGAYLTADEIGRQAAAARKLTSKPFHINLFAPFSAPQGPDAAPLLAPLGRFHQRLGLPPPEIPRTGLPSFASQVEAALSAKPRVFSFAFGIPERAVIDAAKSRGCLVAGTACSVAEARKLEAAGVDLIFAQGAEAGGQRGTFGPAHQVSLVGTFALVPQVVDAVSVPVVAAGGIMDGRGVAAVRVLGASGASLGTAFLTSRESGAAAAYKAAVRAAGDESTRITRALSGRSGRAIANELTDELDATGAVQPFPAQHFATSPVRGAAAKRGDASMMSLWAGQGAALARDLPAAELGSSLKAEMEAALSRASRPSS